MRRFPRRRRASDFFEEVEYFCFRLADIRKFITDLDQTSSNLVDLTLSQTMTEWGAEALFASATGEIPSNQEKTPS